MDPNSNRFVPLSIAVEGGEDEHAALRRKLDQAREALGMPDLLNVPFPADALVLPDGKPVPKHWSVFTVGEDVVIKGYTFRVAYVGETSILFEPVGLPIVGDTD